MQAPVFVCRSCLFRLRRPLRAGLDLRQQIPWAEDAPRTQRQAPRRYQSGGVTDAVQDDRSTITAEIQLSTGLKDHRVRRTQSGIRAANRQNQKSLLTQSNRTSRVPAQKRSGRAQDDWAFWEIFEKVWEEKIAGEIPEPQPRQVVETADAMVGPGKIWAQDSELQIVSANLQQDLKAMEDGQPSLLVRRVMFDRQRPWTTYRWKFYVTALMVPPPARDSALHERIQWLSRDLSDRDMAGALLKEGDVESMRRVWLHYAQEQRKLRWPDVILYALIEAPEKAALLLAATFERANAPKFAITDAFQLLIRELPSFDRSVQPEQAAQVCSAILSILDSCADDPVSLKQDSIYRLLDNLDGPNLETLYKGLQRHQQELTVNTCLQFVSRLAKAGAQKGAALDILERLASRDGFDINGAVGASVCTSILATDVERLSTYDVNAFERLLSLGMAPNIIHWTTVMHRLCLNNDLDAALGILSTLLRHQYEPQPHLWSVLLNGAKKANRMDALQEIFFHADSKSVQGAAIYDDLIHAISQAATVDAQNQGSGTLQAGIIPTFIPVLRLYLKFFEPEPLQRLISRDLSSMASRGLREGLGHDTAIASRWPSYGLALSILHRLEERDERQLVRPTEYTLGLMGALYVRSLHSPQAVLKFYLGFRQLLEDRDPAIMPLLENQWTMVHDAIIRRLLATRETANHGLHIFADMVRPALEKSVSSTGAGLIASAPESAPASLHPPPSIFTFNTLIAHFLHKPPEPGAQPNFEEAKRMIAFMRNHYDLAPDLVTYNTMLAGYAAAQRPEGVLATLDQLKAAGLEADEYTSKAFAMLNDQNREKAVRALREAADVLEPRNSQAASEKTCQETPLQTLKIETEMEQKEQADVPTSLSQKTWSMAESTIVGKEVSRKPVPQPSWGQKTWSKAESPKLNLSSLQTLSQQAAGWQRLRHLTEHASVQDTFEKPAASRGSEMPRSEVEPARAEDDYDSTSKQLGWSAFMASHRDEGTTAGR
jgi:pentatricopeptide repeat protein